MCKEQELDKVSRDVLEETKSVLCELIGYLSAVEKKHGADIHPALRDLSARLDQVVSEIESHDDSSRVLKLADRKPVKRLKFDPP